MNKTYCVDVEARDLITVKAESEEEAKEKAIRIFSPATCDRIEATIVSEKR